VVGKLRINYLGKELRIKVKDLGGNFNNDFEMYQLTGRKRTLIMKYKERWNHDGYRVEVFSEGIIKKAEIEEMMKTLLPLVDILSDARLIIHE